ncbi:unnamed protein product [Blepharisma stoltei]|uniref:Uncharacterized protein n=1 Tax=Blepharisma stoltei TaxID=1481888 RepID=A0AAU9JJF9_9CILI|nr:unnamed protein product [Blepharisma stoltei]
MLCIVIKPLIEEGVIDHRYYRIKVTLEHHLTAEAAIKYLETIWNVIEVRIGSGIVGDDGVLVVFVKFENEQALKISPTTWSYWDTSALYHIPCCMNARGHWENGCAIVKASINTQLTQDKQDDFIKPDRDAMYRCEVKIASVHSHEPKDDTQSTSI